MRQILHYNIYDFYKNVLLNNRYKNSVELQDMSVLRELKLCISCHLINALIRYAHFIGSFQETQERHTYIETRWQPTRMLLGCGAQLMNWPSCWQNII